VPHPDSAHTSLHDPVSTQISLLTNDDLWRRPAVGAGLLPLAHRRAIRTTNRLERLRG
jgi:hypothetical protein